MTKRKQEQPTVTNNREAESDAGADRAIPLGAAAEAGPAQRSGAVVIRAWTAIREVDPSVYTVAIVCIAIIIYTSKRSTTFLDASNFQNIITQVSVVGIVTMAQTILLISGGLDLSVGANVSMTGVIAGYLFSHGHPIGLAVLAALAVAFAIGLLNGLLVAQNRAHPFIVTLGVATFLTGYATEITGSAPYNDMGAIATFFGGNAQFHSIPPLLPVAAALVIVGLILLPRAPLQPRQRELLLVGVLILCSLALRWWWSLGGTVAQVPAWLLPPLIVAAVVGYLVYRWSPLSRVEARFLWTSALLLFFLALLATGSVFLKWAPLGQGALSFRTGTALILFVVLLVLYGALTVRWSVSGYRKIHPATAPTLVLALSLVTTVGAIGLRNAWVGRGTVPFMSLPTLELALGAFIVVVIILLGFRPLGPGLPSYRLPFLATAMAGGVVVGSHVFRLSAWGHGKFPSLWVSALLLALALLGAGAAGVLRFSRKGRETLSSSAIPLLGTVMVAMMILGAAFLRWSPLGAAALRPFWIAATAIVWGLAAVASTLALRQEGRGRDELSAYWMAVSFIMLPIVIVVGPLLLATDTATVSLALGAGVLLAAGVIAIVASAGLAWKENLPRSLREGWLAFGAAVLVTSALAMFACGLLRTSALGQAALPNYSSPTSAILLFTMVCLTYIFLRWTPLGRSAYAIGGNEEAAYLSGIPVKRTKIYLYTLVGLIVGIAGLLQSGILNTAEFNLGSGLELQSIAAAVIGGTALFGGRGGAFRSLQGVFLLGLVANSLSFLGLGGNYQTMATGIIIVFAVMIQKARG